MWRYPLGPPIRHFFEPFHFTACDQLLVAIGASHISSVDSSETPTKLLECRLILTHCSGFHLIRLVSPLRCWLITRVTLRQLLPRAPLSNSLLAFPYPLPVTPRCQVQNPLTGFAPKQTKESSAWRTTYIVLQKAKALSEKGCLVYEAKLYLMLGPLLGS